MQINKLLRHSSLILCGPLSLSADVPHSRIVDDFSNPKNWTAQVINPQQTGPLYHVGLWSDPIKGPTCSVKNGKGYFHFPRLDYWQVQGFENAYHVNHNSQTFPLFDNANYLCFNIINQSAEPVQLVFRVLEDMSYTYTGYGQHTHEEAMAEMLCSPDTVVLPPKVLQKVKIKLTHRQLKEDISMIEYKNQVTFFTFEVKRIVAPTKTKPALDCTLVIDHLRMED